MVGLLVLVAKLYPGSGADLLDWGPTRSYEHEIELEMQDVEQMIEAQNEYRRKRGDAEVSEDEVREDVVREEIRGCATKTDDGACASPSASSMISFTCAGSSICG